MARIQAPVRVLNALTSDAWALRPDYLRHMLSIAQRQPLDLASLNATTAPQALMDAEGEMVDMWVPFQVGHVAIVPVRGPILSYASWLDEICGASSYPRIEHALELAMADPTVHAIVLLMDSPGGEVTGCGDLAALIAEWNLTKPIVAYAAGSMCSAAYWLASACQDIIVSKTAVVGCLGCCGTVRDYSEAEKLAGIRTYEIVSTSTPRKRPDVATDEGRAQILTMIDAMAEVFLDEVAVYRGVPRETVDSDYGQGDVFVGRHAMEAGLADDVAMLQQVVDALQPAEPQGGLFVTVPAIEGPRT